MYSISKGKEDLILTPTSLNECVDFLIQSFSNELSKKRISIDYDHHLNGEIKLLVDPISFKHQVLANIITNAIKFSKEGGIIHINSREIKPNIFSIDITDEGVGIPKELIPHLFADDKKTYRQGTHGETGSGFGLIIMKAFMELYGGAVNIRSNDSSTHQKTGTTFTLILEGTRN
jgi:signal transduction histidine kinase